MNANRIELNGEVLIDLTKDTAQDEDVRLGKTYHRSDGSLGVGTNTGGGGGSAPILEELTATANGEYTPSVDGFSKVTVAVPEVPEWDGLFTKMPSSLAGTTWYISSGWEVKAAYGVFAVSCNVGSLSADEYSVTELRLGYDLTNPYATNEVANHLCTKLTDGRFIEYSEYSNLYIKFLEDGAEELKSWLLKYGKLQ